MTLKRWVSYAWERFAATDGGVQRHGFNTETRSNGDQNVQNFFLCLFSLFCFSLLLRCSVLNPCLRTPRCLRLARPAKTTTRLLHVHVTARGVPDVDADDPELGDRAFLRIC